MDPIFPVGNIFLIFIFLKADLIVVVLIFLFHPAKLLSRPDINGSNGGKREAIRDISCPLCSFELF